MSRLGDLGNKLYRGEVSYDFVGKQKRWYAISALILVLATAGLVFRGLNLGIEFQGGGIFEFQKPGVTVGQVSEFARQAGVEEPVVQEVRRGDGSSFRIQTGSLTNEESRKFQEEIKQEFKVEEVSFRTIGPSWGKEIAQKAVYGLLLFLAIVVIYLALAFEWKMAVAAIIALAHDVVITVGVYALVGFTVTPATVTGLLTILGYSLYDTVVVFDKVRENTRGIVGGNRMTYSQAANLAMNQTLVRSINTSLIALLPVAAILFGALFLLGESVLADLGLALFVGIAAGTYSSVFIATPLLADLKEREPTMKALAKRVAARQGRGEGAKAGRPAKAAARPGQAQEAPVSREEPAEGDAEPAEQPGEAAAVGVPRAGKAAAGAARQQPRRTPQQRPRSSGKSKKRPSGKKRR
jgi:preprotein translocase subunit SecF